MRWTHREPLWIPPVLYSCPLSIVYVVHRAALVHCVMHCTTPTPLHRHRQPHLPHLLIPLDSTYIQPTQPTDPAQLVTSPTKSPNVRSRTSRMLFYVLTRHQDRLEWIFFFVWGWLDQRVRKVAWSLFYHHINLARKGYAKLISLWCGKTFFFSPRRSLEFGCSKRRK